jgi:predicted ArsR family transcriptional regulator
MGRPEQRQRIQEVQLRESGMTRPAIAKKMGVSLSAVYRAHLSYDRGVVARRRREDGEARGAW